MNVLLKLDQTTVTMPKKGHTCCVLGCTVNSKKTVMADGRRPRFFCFPHEKKRPHLRRAWLALTRRPEASTNTRVCEFHFVDGKPSTINPHPILNMGMEATKMQKRAMELRQQKALRKMMLQQQMIAAGQMVPGQELMGLSQEQLQQLEASLSQDQDAGQLPNLDNPLYDDAVKYAASMSLEDGNELPSQIPVSYANNITNDPLSLVMHDRDQCNDGNESMMSNGSLAAELQAEGYEEGEDFLNSSDPLSEDLDQITQPSTSSILPDDCSQMAPLNIKSEGPSPIPPDPASEATLSSSSGLVPTSYSALPSEDNEGASCAINGLPPVKAEESDDQNGPLNGNSIISDVMDSIATSTPQKENGPAPQMVQQKAFPIFRNQMSIQQPKQSPPLKVPSWQVRVNGTASVPSALDVPTPPVAKKPRKRKSTPAIKFMFNNKSKMNTSNSLMIPQVMNSIQTTPKVTNQPGAVMSAQAIESLKSDILENLRAEFLTELQQEVESSKQLKVEMETVRIQTRQELAQMRVELHALWGENQRLRAQVEGLLQEKEVDFESINTGN